MDIADCAQRAEERLIKAIIDGHKSRNNKSVNETIECIDCGEIIPAARREALPGCERCVSCQEIYEGRK